jgi:hypothetical protein
VRFYTLNLPPPIARRRIDEIDADLHDHIAHGRAHGTGDWLIALSIAARMVRGLAADASWRGQTIANLSTPQEVMVSKDRLPIRRPRRARDGVHPAAAPGGDAGHR